MAKPDTTMVMAMSPSHVLFTVVDMHKDWVALVHTKEEWEWIVDREIFQRDWKLFRAARKGI